MLPRKCNALSAFSEIINPWWLSYACVCCCASFVAVVVLRFVPVVVVLCWWCWCWSCWIFVVKQATACRPKIPVMTHKQKTFHCKNEQIAILRDDYVVSEQKPYLNKCQLNATKVHTYIHSQKHIHRMAYTETRTIFIRQQTWRCAWNVALNNLIIWI